MLEDLRWLGFEWVEPMISQSQRRPNYRAALERLHAAKLIYPCTRSRRDVIEAAEAPHELWEGLYAPTDHRRGIKPLPQPADDEPIYPPQFRPAPDAPLPPLGETIAVNWRFRVPDGETFRYHDGKFGDQSVVVGRDFGDFLVWRKDDVPSYQLACVVDDAELGITEVVRGADLIKSTFRQLLLFRALGWAAPGFFHCPLMNDDRGERLAKRHDALSLRTLRERGVSPKQLFDQFLTTDNPDGHR